MEAHGYSGGIWILWKDKVIIDILRMHPQFIHLKVSNQGRRDWLLTMVYGSPNHSIRKKLWRDLNQKNLVVDEPWVIAWDFNSVTSVEEISNSGLIDQRRCAGFNIWLFEHTLIDLGFNGAKFTWSQSNTPDSFKEPSWTEPYAM